MTQAMEPGIYESLPFAEYLAIDALSNTAMGALKKSPRHYKHAQPLPKLKHLVLGSLVHAGRLEPLTLADQYLVMPDFHLDPENQTQSGAPTKARTTSYVKERVAAFEAAADHREIVPRDWLKEMLAIVSSLSADKEADELFNATGPVELTMIWDDAETGIRCKGRIDKVCVELGRFVDLKTTMELEKFPRSFANYNYHRQLAHYQAGYAALTGELLEPWVVAVEKSAPYCCQSAPICEETLAAGESQRRELLELLADCREHDRWPGPPSPKFWRVPDWAFQKSRITETETELIVV